MLPSPKLSPALFKALVLLLLVTLDLSSAYRTFQDAVPNGSKVPNPCDPNVTWDGVGHRAEAGGSILNPFGEDFRRMGKTWDKSLCQLDSDGDGLTNGQELGDPDCSWTPGQTPARPAGSHPGICEPVTSSLCQERNRWLRCDGTRLPHDKLMCEHIEENATFTLDVRLSRAKVPAEVTTYTCQIIDLDLGMQDLHMVATQPIVDASQVVHHILLFGCDPGSSIEKDLYKPHACAMQPTITCRSLISAWTLGSPGECAHPKMGFRMGLRGYRSVALQVHWNNPRQMSGLHDTSGMKIHLTTSLREHDAGVLVVGQRYMQLDPLGGGSSESKYVKTSASCPSHCTEKMFDSPIYITATVNHMHYLGKHQSIKIYRNSTEEQTITDQNNWSYDDPVIYNFKNAIELKPGDEIRTVCTFKRPKTSKPVCWGEATTDEMCFGFITYYPRKPSIPPWCISMRSFPSCERHILERRPFDGCEWWKFRYPDNDTLNIAAKIADNCYNGQRSKLRCTDRCRKLAQSLAQHPCFKGEARSYILETLKYDTLMVGLLDAIITCSCQDADYCDRKVPIRGMLGDRQAEFCPADGQRPTMALVGLVLQVLFSVAMCGALV